MTTPISSVDVPAYAAATNQTPTTNQAATTNQATTTQTATNRSQLDPQAFLRLLVAQLQYQDPSKPVDTASFMAQTATLSQVQTMNAMASTLTSLANAQQAQAATSLIGKSITYADGEGVQRTGVVTSASLLASGATLKVGDADVPLTDVLGVSAAPAGTTP
jgi:flagellar basal-body rod modification protein FlgD